MELKRRWKGIDGWAVDHVLRRRLEEPAVVEALASPDATALAQALVPLITPDLVDQEKTWGAAHALETLGRAGAELSEAVEPLAAWLETYPLFDDVGSALRQAGLNGADLSGVLDRVLASRVSSFVRERIARTERLRRVRGPEVVRSVARWGLHQGSAWRALVEEALIAGEEPPLDDLLPLAVAGLRSPDLEHRRQAVTALRDVWEMPGERVGPALTALADALSDPEIAVLAACAVHQAVVNGHGDLGLRPALERGLDDPLEGVRSRCSWALTALLQRLGLEEPPPEGTSRRRTWARDDTPIGRGGRCAVCGGETDLIDHHHERSNTHELERWEHRCRGCGLYTVSAAGY
ncbi:MAG: hypothetical protein KC621_28455 [Myxococcales bacterium]|nr:hypothetical protein [Myxococcales bacterium]